LRIRKPPGLADLPLDAIDRRILRVLRRDGGIANQTQADEIGLSPPACLKRVRRLSAARIIERTVALLAPAPLGYPLLAAARIKPARSRRAQSRVMGRRNIFASV
jgi:Lrp/AsnC family transcriptional regulator, leucine-responsive regulatory protein